MVAIGADDGYKTSGRRRTALSVTCGPGRLVNDSRDPLCSSRVLHPWPLLFFLGCARQQPVITFSVSPSIARRYKANYPPGTHFWGPVRVASLFLVE